MEDAIEICSGCGKLPRSIDTNRGEFVCGRCGNRTIRNVSATEYEFVAVELDKSFHAQMMKRRLAEARSEPLFKKKARKPAKKLASKKAPKGRKTRR